MKLIAPLISILFLSINKIQATGITIPDNTGLPNPTGGIIGILVNFTSWLLTIFLVLAVLSFVITGIMYILAMGDSRSQNLESAKQNVKFSIIAVAIVGASYIIIQFINDFLTASLIR